MAGQLSSVNRESRSRYAYLSGSRERRNHASRPLCGPCSARNRAYGRHESDVEGIRRALAWALRVDAIEHRPQGYDDAVKGDVHVIPTAEGWCVEVETEERSRSTHETQLEAWLAARLIAQKARGELVVHARDGGIQERLIFTDEGLKAKRTSAEHRQREA